MTFDTPRDRVQTFDLDAIKDRIGDGPQGHYGCTPQWKHREDIRALIAEVERLAALLTERESSWEQLKALQKNWDSYGADPLDPSIVDNAKLFLERAQAVPCCDGSVQIEWHTHDIDLEITFPPEGRASVFVGPDTAIERKPPTPDLEAEIIADMQRISDAVDEAAGTSDYQTRLVALALVARHFLRERANLRDAASRAVPEQEPVK